MLFVLCFVLMCCGCLFFLCFVFFFFKQKTAYEMRISDWSSDVCSSDLITPTLIDRIQDRQGHTIYRHDNRPCPDCTAPWDGQNAPARPDMRPEVIDPVTASQIVASREGVVQRGTDVRSRGVGVPHAGKDGRDTGGCGKSGRER